MPTPSPVYQSPRITHKPSPGSLGFVARRRLKLMPRKCHEDFLSENRFLAQSILNCGVLAPRTLEFVVCIGYYAIGPAGVFCDFFALHRWTNSSANRLGSSPQKLSHSRWSTSTISVHMAFRKS